MKTLAYVIVASVMGAGIAYAQVPPAPAAQPSLATRVENWSAEQWEAAKTEWAKDKAKWATCQQRSEDQGLSGQKNWSFLYTCMTT